MCGVKELAPRQSPAPEPRSSDHGPRSLNPAPCAQAIHERAASVIDELSKDDLCAFFEVLRAGGIWLESEARLITLSCIHKDLSGSAHSIQAAMSQSPITETQAHAALGLPIPDEVPFPRPQPTGCTV